MKPTISIVIPCADDLRIESCIQSIDEAVEVIVALNGPTEEVREAVRRAGVCWCEIPERNLAKALNKGIERAKHDRVILMDSDCRFHPGAIAAMAQALERHLVVKGYVLFEHRDFSSRVIASVRSYTYYDPPKPYNPFLGLQKKVKEQIGGYYFDADIHWTEDADLYVRLKRAGIPVEYAWHARISHPPLEIVQDLRSAFRYGIGKRIRVEKGRSEGWGTHFSSLGDMRAKKGMSAAVYYSLWNVSFLAGTIYQRICDPYRVRCIS